MTRFSRTVSASLSKGSEYEYSKRIQRGFLHGSRGLTTIVTKENAGAAIQQHQISECRSRGEVADDFSILRVWRGLRGSFDFNLTPSLTEPLFFAKKMPDFNIHPSSFFVQNL